MIKKNYSAGLYFIPAFALLSFALFFTSCTKEEELATPAATTEVSTPPLRLQTTPDLFGFYSHTDKLTIGNSSSENQTLTYLQNKNGNMINLYARNYLTSSSKRSQLAAFCRKAMNTYGFLLITVDIRETSEIAGWDAFYTAYPDLRTVVAPLTEKEPWVTGDYSGTFKLLRKANEMCDRYGAKLYFYEGWMGKGYSSPQRAVDSMVYHCDGVFLSNYVSVSDYLSNKAGYGKWDNRIKYRLDQGSSKYGGITKSAKKFNKLDYPIIELQSLDNSMLYSLYAVSGQNKSFYGGTYNDAKTLYGQSNSDVIKYTELIGRCMFHQKYAYKAKP